MEAIRQMGIELGSEKVVYVHLTLVPYIATSSEIKTKLLDVIGGIDSTGISVTEVPDLFDVCGVKAHRVRISHASDLEQPQSFLETGSVLKSSGFFSTTETHFCI